MPTHIDTHLRACPLTGTHTAPNSKTPDHKLTYEPIH